MTPDLIPRRSSRHVDDTCLFLVRLFLGHSVKKRMSSRNVVQINEVNIFSPHFICFIAFPIHSNVNQLGFIEYRRVIGLRPTA